MSEERKKLGPYVIDRRIAAGGMAEVFLAKRQGAYGFSKRTALKRVLPQLTRDQEFVAMFIDEARLAARLQHPNIVQVFDFGEYDGELVLAMEYVDGSHVGKLIRRSVSREELIPQDVVLHVLSQASHALAYAHRATDVSGKPLGIVHRDVSPANLLLDSSGHVKLSDFGIARAVDKVSYTDGGHVRGKMGYMSPEQVVAKELDGRSDVFTLATVGAEMLIGAPLFGEGDDLEILLRIRDGDLSRFEELSTQLPRDIVRLLRSALTPNREDRPTARQFAEAVDQVIRRRGSANGAEMLSRLLMRFRLQSVDAIRAVTPSMLPPAGGHVTDELTDPLRDEQGMYRVKLPDDSVFGPLTFPTVTRLIAGGEVHAETPVSKRGGPFEPISTLEDFKRFFFSAGLHWRVEGYAPVASDEHGQLEPGALLPLVHDLIVKRRTGALILQATSLRQKKIFFVEGYPEFVASTDPSELLGEFLVSSAICLRMEVDMALGVLHKYDGRLGDALVDLGILTPMELYRALEDQVRFKYLQAFRWNEGTWRFVSDVRADADAIAMSRSVGELQREAVLVMDSAVVLRALESRLKGRTVKLNPSPSISLHSFHVSEAWARLIAGADGLSLRAALKQGEQREDINEDDAVRALFLAVSAGILIPAGEDWPPALGRG